MPNLETSRPAPRRESRLLAVFVALLLAVLVPGTSALAQETTPEEFAEQSLGFRTALHYDPLLDQPLDALVRLYREEDRVDELIGLYRSHTEQYPDDAGAKSVLVRILRKVDRPGSGELIASAVPLHPNFAPLQYLLFQFLEEKGDERANEALSRAIDLETNAARRGEWLEELLQVSEGEKARALATTQLQKLLTAENQSGDSMLGFAKLMQRYQFWELSLEALDKARKAGLTAEAKVEADLYTARGLSEVGESERAGKVLDDLLGKLAPDHWRRREIMSLRVGVVASEEERDRMLEKFREIYLKNPKKESAVLDYSEILIAGERQTEAAELLVNAAASLPGSATIETRALELLESINDAKALEAFLEERLELDPERADLRFRLVKVLYVQGRDAEAEQDFQVVLAGLEPDDISERILDLQRYLRGIERIDAAGKYLERYVRNHPTHLDVARELAEIHVALGDRAAVDQLVNRLDPTEAPEEAVVDLAEFLVASQFFASARHLLSERIALDPDQFRVGLLLIEVFGNLGDAAGASRLISRMREMTDTPERYAQWLQAAVVANGELETLDQFFDSEQTRFSFDDGEWPPEKVEKFVILCEAGKQRLLTDRVAQALRRQLASGTFDSRLRIRLRRFLVGVLESDPAATAEVEEQLKQLASEDPANRIEYDLQRALVYHRSQRVDLAQDLLVGIDLASVTSVGHVQEAVEVLTGYGFLEEAATALAAVNRLAPEDVFSWEKRLTLLAVIGDETGFRSVVRSLRNGDAGVGLREDSIRSLERHLLASYWRSVARLVASGEALRFEEVLPILASVDRENQSYRVAAWTEWSRAMVLQTLGRTEEAGSAMERFLKLVSEQEIESITFPDGLTLSVDGAKRFLGSKPAQPDPVEAPDAAFLNGKLSVRWAFETDRGARILRTGRSGGRILALDERGTVYGIAETTGKLLWRRSFGRADRAPERRPDLFLDLPLPKPASSRGDREPGFKIVRPFAITTDRFLLIEEGVLQAHAAVDGGMLWSASLPFTTVEEGRETRGGARPGDLLAVTGERAFVFRPESSEVASFDLGSGKLLWTSRFSNRAASPAGALFSLNAGLEARDGLVFLYGWESLVLDAESGTPLWDFSEGHGLTFPVVLRKDRGDIVEGPTVEDRILANGEETWQGGHRGEAPNRRELIDFLREDDPTISLTVAPDHQTAMLSPAVYWTQARLLEGVPALGKLEGGYLWLMQEGSVRRVSNRLPVASRELPASGTFLGRVGNHLWFRDGATLRHLDFNYHRVSALDLGTIGSRNLRAALSGNQLVVRGESGLRVINALTGRVIGSATWPPELLSYLEGSEEKEDPSEVLSLWQGEVRVSERGEPGFCIPVADLVLDSGYVTRFGGRSLVCLAAETAPPAPESSR